MERGSEHKTVEPKQATSDKGSWPSDKMPSSAAYEALFDSGYSSTALSVHSASNLFQSQSSVDFDGTDYHQESSKVCPKSPPATDSGLRIDSGLSLDSSSSLSSGSDPVRKRLSAAITARISADNACVPFKRDDDGDT